MAKERPVAICADDYALSFGVSVGILKALSEARVSAASAIVTSPRWPAMGRELIRFAARADIGLHLNLTIGRPLGPMPRFAPEGRFPGMAPLARRSLAGRLPLDEIRAEIGRQLDRFETVVERPPDYVDGHQHVHVLKGVRAALFDALATRGLAGKVWLRDPGDSAHRIALRRANARKALAVRALATGFRRAARRRGFRLNDGFAGFSDFNPGRDYALAFETYLRAPGRRHIVMCHPGHVDEDLRLLDPVTVTREQELAFLLSPALPVALARHNMRLVRPSALF
jgi:predicted glycoside hydrolase/deacetylase ChbG (UPF0249 family)